MAADAADRVRPGMSQAAIKAYVTHKQELGSPRPPHDRSVGALNDFSQAAGRRNIGSHHQGTRPQALVAVRGVWPGAQALAGL
jgi:hypothetical protein